MIQKLLILLTGLFFLSACNSTGIMKRRYTKGYYVSHKKHSVETPEKKVSSSAAQVAQQIKVVASESEINSQPSAIAISPSIVASTPKSTHSNYGQSTTSHQSALASVERFNQNSEPTFRALSLEEHKALIRGSRSSDDSKVYLVLMIILCFFPFINLIPVYLHDGKVTLNFWITLLLDFTWIGGIIFSLLVILDVVNLAD